MGWWACSEIQIRIWFPLVSLDKSKAWWHSTILHCGLSDFGILSSIPLSKLKTGLALLEVPVALGIKFPVKHTLPCSGLGSHGGARITYTIFCKTWLSILSPLAPNSGLAHSSQHDFNVWQILSLLVCHWFPFTSRMCSLNNFPFCNLFNLFL